MPAQKAAKRKSIQPSRKAEHATVPLRVSPTTYKHIISKAVWGETIDRTLQRLLGINGGRS